MPRETLREQLTALHDTLQEIEGADASAMEEMHSVAADLDRLLSSSEAASEESVHGIRTRLAELGLQFETEHPRVASLITQITNLLGSIGI